MGSENGLPIGWEARLGLNGRVYYYSKRSQIVQILPPPETWRCKYCLPYGWEMAVDYDHKNYYINHVTQTVTYEDPRTEDDQSMPLHRQGSLPPPDLLMSPQPREYLILRDAQMGFGFIAGSEKPVVIRSVTPGGPSEGKLLADDQILKIGSENVMLADRERVIQLIRKESKQVAITVLQPNRSANSAFLNPAKKTFRTTDRPKVRFADHVIVDGEERVEGSSPLLISPGVLRVELENRQTKSFRFNPETTAGDAVAALCEELGFRDPNLFSLVFAPPVEMEDSHTVEKSAKSSSSSTASEYSTVCSSSPDSILIPPWDSLSKVVNNPSVRHHYCYFRLEFMPRDFHNLARSDPESFKYLYTQCVNDVVAGDIYKDDLGHEEFVKLAALQMQELVLSGTPITQQKKSSGLGESPLDKNAFRFSGVTNKLTLKYLEKEFGLKRFLPPSVLNAMRKDNATARNIRKLIQQYLKASYNSSFFNQHPTSPIIPTSPILLSGGNADAVLLQLRLQYLKILSPQHLFGGRFFSASMQALMESDISILVGHNYGVSQMINAKTKMVSVLAEFQNVAGFEIAPSQAESSTTTVKIEFAETKELVLTMNPQDAHNFAFMVAGYCRVYGNNDMVLTLPMAESTSAPIYFGPHKVKPSHWNYPPPSPNGIDSESGDFPPPPSYFYCDFSEPITPALLSQDTPPIMNSPQKNGYVRPPTPPPVLEYPIEEDDQELNRSTLSESEINDSDANNNESSQVIKPERDIRHENVEATSPDSPVSSLSAGVHSDLSESNSISNPAQDDIPTYNGYLLPTPPSERAARITAQANEIQHEDSEGEGAWNDLMQVLSKEKTVEAHAPVLSTETHSNKISTPPSTKSKQFQNQAIQGAIVVPPPPDYPPPKRKESIKKDSSDKRSQGMDSSAKNKEDDSQNSTQFSSFKPNDGDMKVFANTQSEIKLASQPSSPINQNPPSDGTDGSHTKSLENFGDVSDPLTRKKLQETEDLIEYFRRKRQEMVEASSDGNIAASSNAADDLNGPMIVSDIAAGNKRLRKAEKASNKNRKSWAGSDTLHKVEDPGTLSISNPDLSASSSRKRTNRGIFRKIFGDRRKKSTMSMYESPGSSSAYGKRKRRFRLPKLRLRKAFSLKSSRKNNRKSVIPTSVSSAPARSSPFRFPHFSSKKSRNHGILVISEPCDGVRGVDLLPSGKYTVAGAMFDGDAKDTEVITLDSKQSSRENLSEEVQPKPVSNLTPSTSSQEASKVLMRPTGSVKGSKRPFSYSTFQQAVIEGHTVFYPSSTLSAVDEGRRNSLSLNTDRLSPCELSQTESAEALQDVTVNHNPNSNKTTESVISHTAKPQRKLVPVVNPVVPPQSSRKSATLPVKSHSNVANATTTSTPAHEVKKVVKKRPSHKRPAPPPPPVPSIKELPISKKSEANSDGKNVRNEILQKNKENGRTVRGQAHASSDDDDRLFDPKSDESVSLMTEIFAYLKSSNPTDAAEIPDLPEHEEVESNQIDIENALPYDEGYVMPGVKATDIMKVERMATENEKEKITTEQQDMYKIFYNEMLADNYNSRLTLGGESLSGSDADRDSDLSSGDGARQGSYDVTTYESSSDQGEETAVTLKHFGYRAEEDVPNLATVSSRIAEITEDTEDDTNDEIMLSSDGNLIAASSADDESDITTDKTKSDYGTTDDTDFSETSSPKIVGNSEQSVANARFTYSSLVTPHGYNKGVQGVKRAPQKPRVPPKPVFH